VTSVANEGLIHFLQLRRQLQNPEELLEEEEEEEEYEAPRSRGERGTDRKSRDPISQF
jgi:hypothetical protein